MTDSKPKIKNLHVRVDPRLALVVDECMFRRRHKSLQETLMEALNVYIKWVEEQSGEIKVPKQPSPTPVRAIAKR